MISAFLTCRNDSNAKQAGRQHFIRTVWIYAAVDLRPPYQTVDDLTKHAVPSHAHHAGFGTKVKVKYLNSETHQNSFIQ